MSTPLICLQRHLDCLSHLSDNNWIIDKYQVYLEAADSLVDAGLFQNALSIYISIKQVPELATAYIHIKMAKCFQGLGVGFKAEECLQTAIQVDEDDVDARMELAKMYEDLGQKEQAFILVNEAIQKKRDMHAVPPTPYKNRKRGRPRVNNKRNLDTTHSIVATKHRRAGTYKPRTLADPEERVKEEIARAKQLDNHYSILLDERGGMRNGDKMSTEKWIDAARDLTNDFRACNAFYDGVVILKFLGYTGIGSQPKVPIDPELTEIADRLSKSW
jgi:general transcription factor 3C polypeptide 3 (transcription factor C subunit 4)